MKGLVHRQVCEMGRYSAKLVHSKRIYLNSLRRFVIKCAHIKVCVL